MERILPFHFHFNKVLRLFTISLIIFFVFDEEFLCAQKKETPKEKIQIIQADYAVYDTAYAIAHRLKGNVVFKHENAYMFCDSAQYFEKTDVMKAFGKVHVQQGDSMNIYGDSLYYDGKKKLGKIRGHVRMVERDLVLLTDSVDYDMNKSIGRYRGGGTITSAKNKNTLKSKAGYYYSKSKDFYFKGDVLLKNLESELTCDTLRYNIKKEIAYFISDTKIRTKDTTEIFTNKGWYDTKKDYAALFNRSLLHKKEKEITADTILYDRKKGIGKLFGKAWLYDTTQHTGLFGKRGFVDELNETFLLTGNPFMIKKFKKDTLTLRADTIFSEKDTAGLSTIKAWHDVKFLKGKMSGKSDSLVFSEPDSLLKFYTKPVLWYDDKQLTGDFMQALVIKNEVKNIFIKDNSFIISKADTIGYNQIKGKNIFAIFADEEIRKVKVEGNGQTVYYVKEDGKPYKNVNRVDCSDIILYLKEGKIKDITFSYQPEGTIYPINNFPAEEKFLKGFNWNEDKRPSEDDFIVIMDFLETL